MAAEQLQEAANEFQRRAVAAFLLATECLGAASLTVARVKIGLVLFKSLTAGSFMGHLRGGALNLGAVATFIRVYTTILGQFRRLHSLGAAVAASGRVLGRIAGTNRR